MLCLTFIIDVGCSSTVTSSVTSPMQNSPASHVTQHAGYSSQGSQLLSLNSGTTYPESLDVNAELTVLSDDTNDSDQQHDQVDDTTSSETQNYGDSNVGASR